MEEPKIHLVPALLCRIPDLDSEGEFPEGIVSVSECGMTIIERNSLPENLEDDILDHFPRLAWAVAQFRQHIGVDFLIILDEAETDNLPAVHGTGEPGDV